LPRSPNDLVTIDEEARVHALGKDLVSRFAMLFKTVRIHSVHNAALQYSVKIFTQAGNDLYSALGDFVMRGDVDSVFINELRIRPEAILWDNIVAMLKMLGRSGVGGLNFSGMTNPVEVRKVLQVLLDNPTMDPITGHKELNDILAGNRITAIRFLPRMSLVTDAQPMVNEEVHQATQSMRVYTELIVTWKAYLNIQDEAVPDIIMGRLLTAVQASVDLLHDDPDWFLSATLYRDESIYPVIHAVNSALLSMSLGYRIEMNRKMLMNVGMSAMYAESGRRKRPARDSSIPYESVKEILQTPALTRGQRDRIVVAFEHRLGIDEEGGPTRIRGKTRHLFSRMVALASRYDALTSTWGGTPAVSPSQALETITSESERYDSRLLAVFAHMLGPFPIGSFVELSTGETAVVFRLNPDLRFRARPLVRIIRNSSGQLVQPTLFDLTDGEDGGFFAWIRRALPPGEVPDIDPVQVVFAPTEQDIELGPKWTD
jgi:HD-GYP domain-containing protein (c-di-GMP phosphodiesterase class II)